MGAVSNGARTGVGSVTTPAETDVRERISVLIQIKRKFPNFVMSTGFHISLLQRAPVKKRK